MSKNFVKITCKCGATFEATLNTYINGGGAPDSGGRVFIAELRADEWLDRHQACLPQTVTGTPVLNGVEIAMKQ